MSTTPATVQWPAGTTCSECLHGVPTDEVLDRIAKLLGQPDWDGGDSGDLLMEVRQIVAATGRTAGA